MLCYLFNCGTGLEIGFVCYALDMSVEFSGICDVNDTLNIVPFQQVASSGMKAKLLICSLGCIKPTDV